MAERMTQRIGLGWRMVLIVIVYVAIGGGVMMLLGQPPMWPVFAALGVVTALGVWMRWKKAPR